MWCDLPLETWKKKRILYQLDHRGVCLAAEITEKQPMTRPRCEDRPRRPPKHPNSALRDRKRKASDGNSGGIYRRWDLLLVPICERITHFFITPFYLFILFPNSFLIHLKGGNKISSQTHKYCQSEWITTAGQVVSESRRRSGKKVITVTRRRQSRLQIISISHMELKIVLCHIVFPHMLSKTGFRYANYVRREGGREGEKKVRNCKRREEKENTQPRGWHPGVSLCHAVWFLRELDGF